LFIREKKKLNGIMENKKKFKFHPKILFIFYKKVGHEFIYIFFRVDKIINKNKFFGKRGKKKRFLGKLIKKKIKLTKKKKIKLTLIFFFFKL
jgi:nitrogenase subunit NifH